MEVKGIPHLFSEVIQKFNPYHDEDITKGYTLEVADNEENVFTITKAEEDKRLVFGWANVAIRANGEQIEDLQGDVVEPEDLEGAVYEYVLNFRDGGEEHVPGLRKKARMVESVIFTEEKLKAMGIPLGTVPLGWWIGFYVDDDEAWEKVKDGTYTMFSVEGKGVRHPIHKSASNVAQSFEELVKFNPYHDRLGRFASAGNAVSFTYAPGKSKAHDKAIGREKKRTAAAEKQKEKERINNRIKIRNAKNRAALKNTQAHQKYKEFENSLRRKYPPKDMFDTTSWHSRATEQERNKLEDLDDARVFRNKRGQWQIAKSFYDILKFNPYHDKLGRFTTGGGFMGPWSGPSDRRAVTFSANPETRAGAMAIARESGNHETIGRAYGLNAYKPKGKPKTEKPKAEKPKAEKPKAEKPKVEKPKAEKPQESGFKAASTKAEAIAYANKQLGIQKVSYGSKLDLETINHVNEQITKVYDRCPELKGSLNELKTTTKQRTYAYAQTLANGEMKLAIGTTIYGKGMSHVRELYKKDVQSGFHPKGTDASSIIAHEMGHIYNYLKVRSSTGVAANATFENRLNYANDLNRRTTAKKWLEKAASSVGKSTSDFSKAISKYASKNASEAFAEAFAEFNNSPNPRPECIALMKAAGVIK